MIQAQRSSYGTIKPATERIRNTTAGCRQQPRSRWPRLRLLMPVVLLLTLFTGGWYTVPVFKKYQHISTVMETVITGKYHLLRSAPFIIKAGTPLTSLTEHLQAIGYEQKNSSRLLPGEYHSSQNRFFLATDPEEGNNQPLSMVLEIENKTVQLISNTETGLILRQVQLSPRVLTSFIDSLWEVRSPLPLEAFPANLIQAVLATEDRMFFSHPGFASNSILRAAWTNIRHGRVVQGGSTLTQQMVKILLKRKERTFARKVEEVFLALALEHHYSKQEIITAYLNNVYMGQEGPFALHGMGAAAHHLLGKQVAELNLQECALLAGLIRSPNGTSPRKNPQAALRRTETVLNQMAENGHVQAAINKIGPLDFQQKNDELSAMAWVIARLEQRLKTSYRFPPQKGLQWILDLNVDPEMQFMASQVLAAHLEDLEQKHKQPADSLQGAVVILEPESGSIRALVGGRDYLASQFNRATSARRQVGSLIKPFVYLAAMDGNTDKPVISQASIVDDRPITLEGSNPFWQPRNFDRRYLGRMTVRQALAGSRNIPAVQAGMHAGIGRVAETIKGLRITPEPRPVPSLFLGVTESSPLKMAAAYGTLANQGQLVTPSLLKQFEVNGQVIGKQPGKEKILDPGLCYVMTDMLNEVLHSGTGKSARKHGLKVPAAGKSGTSSGLRDGWFAGYTPSLVIVVWVGRDDNSPIGISGSASALPVWARLMSRIQSDNYEKFQIPADIRFMDIDQATGRRALGWQKKRVRMAFLAGTTPDLFEQQQVVAFHGNSIPVLRATAKRKY